MLPIYLYYYLIPVIFTNDEAFNIFINEDPILVGTVIIVPTIIHGIFTYSIINNIIYFDTTTHILIFTYFLPLLR